MRITPHESVRAIVFACQSRACAPPPVGTGGSIGTGQTGQRLNPVGVRRFTDESDLRAFAKQTFEGKFAGLTTSVRDVQLLKTAHGQQQAFVSGTIRNADGQIVGTFVRTFFPEGNADGRARLTDASGAIASGTVSHEGLILEPPYQRRGFGAAFNAHAEMGYANAGYTQIEIDAGSSVGGYAWARSGYRLRDGDSWSRDNLLKRAETFGTEGQLTSNQVDELRSLIQSGDMPTIANLPYGKRFLLGSTWSGMRPVRILAVTAAATALTVADRLAIWAAKWEPLLSDPFEPEYDSPDYAECWAIASASGEAAMALDKALKGHG